MGTSSPIRGKIAAVLTDKQVAINRGKIHGVTPGMNFTIYLTIGPISDPDDPENVIEGLRYKKGTITVSGVHDTMSFCDINGVYNIEFLKKFDDELKVYPPVAAPLISPDDWRIKAGDIVEHITEYPHIILPDPLAQ